ncbi:MAG: glycosyltransferase [Muribaculaceae bacterium]|nr:glycosyltransferase [Muribaculaceae bacterium]MDE6648991.1 glycosyltransferase [Muribaculaceae bacterium]
MIMDTRPLISVITITYNASATLPVTMKSVAEQTFTGFEHIVVDGASTDDTIMIARRMGTPTLRIVSEPDKGLYDAMNKGLRLARGRYVIFLNSGDRFHAADTLQIYADAIECRNPDIIYGDTDIVDSEGKRLGPRHLSAPDILTADSFSNGMLICHQAFMVRKDIAPKYDTDYRFSADYDWCIKCIKASRAGDRVNLRRVTIDYLSDGLTDHNKKASLIERFKIMAAHYGTLKAIGSHLSFIPRVMKRGKL